MGHLDSTKRNSQRSTQRINLLYQCETALKLLDKFLCEPAKCNLTRILLVFSKLQPAD
jgi:hypothetical protein